MDVKFSIHRRSPVGNQEEMIAPANSGREAGCNGKPVNGITFDIGMGRLIELGRLGGVMVVGIALLPFYAQAQTATAAGAAPTQSKIQVHTEEVIAPVTVLDKRGAPQLNLTQKDFRVFDNGVEQRIDHWDLGGDPVAVALVIETSSHVEMMAPVIHAMGSIFTETVMALNGEAALITYDSTVTVRQAFTHDHDDVQQAIAQVKFEAPEMRLYDAMAEAVEQLKTRPLGYRRVMLVVGESQDIASDAKLGLVLRDAQLANVAIYAIGPSSSTADLRFGAKPPNRGIKYPPGVFSGPTRPGAMQLSGNGGSPGGTLDLMPAAIWLITRGTNEINNHQLSVAAAATGGMHYRALRDRTVRAALDQIASELHAQYSLGYAPTVERSTGFHTIQVSVARPDVTVRTRLGYFVAGAGDGSVDASPNSGP
jgi:VWFA-related protein